MKELGIREVRRELPRLDELVRREGEVLITRHGKPIARLLPIVASKPAPSHAALRARMARLKTGSEVHVRAERDDR